MRSDTYNYYSDKLLQDILWWYKAYSKEYEEYNFHLNHAMNMLILSYIKMEILYD